MCLLRLSPEGRNLFNFIYFSSSLAAFYWVLREPVLWRPIPISGAVWICIYSALALLSFVLLFAPRHFFLSSSPVLSSAMQRRLRCLALLIPVPFFIYIGVYEKTLHTTRGTCASVKKVARLARFEKAAFGKDRADLLISEVKLRWERRAKELDRKGQTRQSAKVRRNVERLETLSLSEYRVLGVCCREHKHRSINRLVR